MSKDIGFCSITEDLCKKDGKCEDCSLKHIHENIEHYAKLHEKNRLIELLCKKVFRIINGDSPKYAFVDSIPIEMMPIYELKYIDNGNIFFSTKEKAAARLKELEGDKE